MRTTNCGTCDRPGLSAYRFRVADQDTRDQWRLQGLVRIEARGLCQTCYKRARADGSLTDFERRNRPAVELLEEWDHLADPLVPVRTEARRLASQFGMHWRSLERAVSRAGVRSRFHGGHGERAKVAA